MNKIFDYDFLTTSELELINNRDDVTQNVLLISSKLNKQMMLIDSLIYVMDFEGIVHKFSNFRHEVETFIDIYLSKSRAFTKMSCDIDITLYGSYYTILNAVNSSKMNKKQIDKYVTTYFSNLCDTYDEEEEEEEDVIVPVKAKVTQSKKMIRKTTIEQVEDYDDDTAEIECGMFAFLKNHSKTALVDPDLNEKRNKKTKKHILTMDSDED